MASTVGVVRLCGTTLRPPSAAATAPAGAAAAGGQDVCRGGRGPDRPRRPPARVSLYLPQHAPFPSLPPLTLCPPASASTVRSNLRGNPPPPPPLSVPAPWPCPAPCLLVLPHPPLPLVPGCRVSGLLSLCPRPPSTPPACTVQSNVRGNPPTPYFSFCPLVSWSFGKLHARCTAPACGLFPSTPALPPSPSPALFPF